jgi:hypothetical protein
LQNAKKSATLGLEGKCMEESPIEAIPAFGPQTKRPVNKRFIYLVMMIIVLLVVFFSYKIFGTKNKGTISQNTAVTIPTASPQISNTVTTTPIFTTTPNATPTINPVDKSSGLDRSKLSVTIQNGNGEEGVAGKSSDILKNLGYDVISTGNADNFDYVNVVIQVKSTDIKYLDLLKKDLGLSYTIGTNSADLPDSFSSSALVIIGK